MGLMQISHDATHMVQHCSGASMFMSVEVDQRLRCALTASDQILPCSRYLQMYPSELQLNKANTSDTEATFLDMHLSNSNDIVSD